MIPVQVVIPYLAMRWCLVDCLESFGLSKVPVLVVDNSGGELSNLRWPDNVEIDRQRDNVGISAAWNRGLAKGAEQTVICSQFVRLSPAELNRRVDPWGLDHLAKGLGERATPYGCTFGDQGFHLISIGRALVDAIGTFDEQFLAYGEDDDYSHRMDLAGLAGTLGNWGDSGAFSIGYGVQKRSGAIEAPQSGRMASYWRHKWGCESASSTDGYPTPFGNPDHPLSHWPPAL